MPPSSSISEPLAANASAPHEAGVINVGLIGIGVVGAAVLEFFAGAPMELTVPAPRIGQAKSVRLRLWSAARRSSRNPKGASEERIEGLVTRDREGRPRFYADDRMSRSDGPAWRRIVRDDQVDIVIELTGSPVAEAIIQEALWAGKCVVTANKAVLSRTGADQVQLAQSRNTILAYEAAVGGGMPVVQTIAAGVGGKITAILGILNGTTNFILSRMRDAMSEPGAYPAAVCAAIHGGLAEADPSADVLGADAQAKIAILAGLAFGVRLRPRDVYVRGIARRAAAPSPMVSQRSRYHACADEEGSPCAETCGPDDHLSTQPILHAPDMRGMERLGLVPKLLSGAQRFEDRVVAWAQPAAVPLAHAFAGIGGSDNACLLEVESPAVGGNGAATRFPILLRGPGAGGPETASSVISDVLFCAHQLAARGVAGETYDEAPLYMYGPGAFEHVQSYEGAPSLVQAKRLVAPYLLRFICEGGDGEVRRALAAHGVEIEPLTDIDAPSTYRYYRTHEVGIRQIEQAIEAALKGAGAQALSLDVLYLPILDGVCFREEGPMAGSIRNEQ